MKAFLALAALFLATALHAENAAEPFAVQASGTLPVGAERRLVLDGLAGDIVLQLGKPGEIRFLSRAMGKKDEVPVALYEERGAVVFRRPKDEVEFVARTLQMTIPPEVQVRVAAPLGGKLTASGLRGGLEISGRALTVDARGLGSDLELEIEGGTAVVSMVAGGARLRLKESNATVDGVTGPLFLTMVKGTATVRNLGSIDADVDEAEVKIERVSGSVRAVGRGGSIGAVEIGGGGDFRLAGTLLVMAKSKGDITVSSDADVRYNEMEADLHLDVYGGSVRGEGNKGIVEIRTRNAEVQIDRNQGDFRVEGDGLKLGLSQIEGETVVIARTSDVTLDTIKGTLTVECDRGDLVVNRSGPSVTAKVDDGDVRMEEINGSIVLQADGSIVDVLWASLSDKDSRIVNTGGDVTLRFAAVGGGGRIEARSKSGRVTSDLARVRVTDDGSQAQGILGNGQRPTIVVEASRDIALLSGR